jgi:hypothetical protein
LILFLHPRQAEGLVGLVGEGKILTEKARSFIGEYLPYALSLLVFSLIDWLIVE